MVLPEAHHHIFVVKVMKITWIAMLCVLLTHVLRKWTSQLWCYIVRSILSNLVLILVYLLSGNSKRGLQSGLLVQK